MPDIKSLTPCFFSDEKVKRFQPLTLTRPLDDLRIGVFTIREKWMLALQTDHYCRLLQPSLDGVFERGTPPESSRCLWINSRFLPSQKLLSAIDRLEEGQKLIFKGAPVAAILPSGDSNRMFEDNHFDGSDLNPIELQETIHLENLWDLLTLNAYEIDKDLPKTGLQSVFESGIAINATCTNPENIYIHSSATVEPGCIIIAEEGPVIIQEGATIEAGSILRGPISVGKQAIIKMRTRIYGGTTVGPVCKVGGEISNCIFHSYSNKAHDGFTGNSIFGQWVNLGADTNTSNLKNNYSTVRITDWHSQQTVETEAQFLGTIMGDHSKTAINTMLNTGTICGVSANIFMNGFPPKYIPSFAWAGSPDFSIYKLDKALEAMEAMMKRRDIELTPAYKKMMQHLFNLK